MLKIVDADENTVTLDMNNPMCGKVLNFKVTLRQIEE
jgi:FKBP-type peptidyl-prolyl cis-trans isomerase 2